MMKSIPLFAISCWLLFQMTAAAQAPPELRSFEQAAGNGSVLFRGKQADTYGNPANGNPYWSSTTFVPGEIVFEGRFYDDILVNIDAITGDPNVEGLPAWRPYTAANGECFIFDHECYVRNNFDRPLQAILNDCCFKQLDEFNQRAKVE